MRDPDLERLLRAAGKAKDESPAEMPFGFDTRVLATLRAARGENGASAWSTLRFVRRIATAASVVAVCLGAAAYWQLEENDDFEVPTVNAYAIADSVIDSGAWQ